MPRAVSSFFVLSLLPLPAMAYLDPGTGSIILQGAIAGIAAAGFTIKLHWYKPASRLGKKPPERLPEDDAENDPDAS